MPNGRNNKTTRVIAFAVLVCLVVFSVCTVVFVAEHIHHNCTGAQCETCVQLHQAAGRLKLLVCTGFATAATAAAIYVVIRVLFECRASFVSTLVSQKVQLNN